MIISPVRWWPWSHRYLQPLRVGGGNIGVVEWWWLEWGKSIKKNFSVQWVAPEKGKWRATPCRAGLVRVWVEVYFEVPCNRILNLSLDAQIVDTGACKVTCRLFPMRTAPRESLLLLIQRIVDFLLLVICSTDDSWSIWLNGLLCRVWGETCNKASYTRECILIHFTLW